VPGVSILELHHVVSSAGLRKLVDTVTTAANNPLLIIQDFETFKHKAFAKLWAACGQMMSEEMPAGTVELLRSTSGVVLDVGPGTGTQLHLFDPSKIQMMYGVEPAVDMHAELRINAEKTGFRDKYEIIAAGAEVDSLIPALAKKKLLQNYGENKSDSAAIFDTVVCCRVLCGVPRPAQTVEGLYRCLKPGGRMLICEHVVNPWPNSGALVGFILQKVYMLLGWPYFIGGCCLDRDTEKLLRDVAKEDGGWEKFDIKRLESWSCLPFIVGEVEKRSTAH